jgi:hypothetical protein
VTADALLPEDPNERADADARAVLAESVSAHADDFAEVIGGFFLAAGVDPELGAAALERAARRVRSREATLQVSEREPWLAVADAIALWWRDSEYVDDSGRPRALPDRGPAPSLEALFARTVAPAQRERARALLRRRVAVERDGAWHFVEDQAVLRLGAREGVHRLLRGISGWCRTYVHNQTRIDRPLKLRYFDAAAHVARVPWSAVPELCAKVWKRLRPVLEEFDASMGAAAARGDPGPFTTVSITAFLHTADAECDPAGDPRPSSTCESTDSAPTTTSTRDPGEESSGG